MVEDVKSESKEKFTFHYYGHPGWPTEDPYGKVGTCPIEIKRRNGKTTVIITEPEGMVTTSVTNMIEAIATKLYYHCLRNEAPAAITWMQHDIRDMSGQESICDVLLIWNGEQYVDPQWSRRRPVADYCH